MLEPVTVLTIHSLSREASATAVQVRWAMGVSLQIKLSATNKASIGEHGQYGIWSTLSQARDGRTPRGRGQQSKISRDQIKISLWVTTIADVRFVG